MVHAQPISEQFDFICEADREEKRTYPEYVPTVFHLRSPDLGDDAWITDLAIQHRNHLPQGTVMLRLVRRYVVGWENFTLPDGTSVDAVFEEEPLTKRQVLSRASYLAISRSVRLEIMKAIINAGVVDEDTKEKSEPEPTSSTEKSKQPAQPAATTD